jgi:hypothetical protein
VLQWKKVRATARQKNDRETRQSDKAEINAESNAERQEKDWKALRRRGKQKTGRGKAEANQRQGRGKAEVGQG